MNQDLINAWKEVYLHVEELDNRSATGNADWESLCVGWCIARGLTIEAAFEFYQETIML